MRGRVIAARRSSRRSAPRRSSRCLPGADALLLGVGVVAIFVGVLLLGPVMAQPDRPRARAPRCSAVRGITGAMARGNVQRNPRRTARTAAPVLIGVALVTGATVFAARSRRSCATRSATAFVGDYVINSTNGGSLSFSQDFVDQLNALPEVRRRPGSASPACRIADGKSLSARPRRRRATPAACWTTTSSRARSPTSRPQGMLISTGEAKRKHLDRRVDAVTCASATSATTVTVQGIYASSRLAQARVVDRALLDGTVGRTTRPAFVFADRADGVSDAAFRTAVNARSPPTASARCRTATSSSTAAATSSTRACRSSTDCSRCRSSSPCSASC